MPNMGLTSRAIIGAYYQTLEAGFPGSWAGQLGSYFRSNQDSETYNWLGMSPAMREWVDERLAKGLRTAGLTIDNKTFEATLQIDTADLRRDKTGQTLIRIAELADRTNEHWQDLLHTLIVNGNGTSSGLCYDGQQFFDVDHSEGDSGTQLNLLAAAQVAQLDVTTPAAPTEAEMAVAILNVIAYMLGYKDDRGKPINGSAREFMVMVPTNLYGPALSAATSRLLAAGGAMGDNPLSNTPFKINVVCNPALTDTTVFRTFRTDARVKPFILQEELPPEISAIAEGSEEEFLRHRHLYGVEASRNVGYGMWQYASHSTLS